MGVSVILSHAHELLGCRLERLVPVAMCVDRSPVDQIILAEHTLQGARMPETHPSGSYPYSQDEPYGDPLIVRGALALVTHRVRLSTGILIVPLRPAPLLAKECATVNVLSRGRLDLGVGTGWQAEEFDAACVPR